MFCKRDKMVDFDTKLNLLYNVQTCMLYYGIRPCPFEFGFNTVLMVD